LLSGDIDRILNWDFFCIITGQDFKKAF